MKKWYAFLTMCIYAMVLCSCDSEISKEEREATKKLLAWQKQTSHYFGKSVYSVGDEIQMVTNSGDLEIFSVEMVEEGGVVIAGKLDGDEDEEGEDGYIYISDDVVVDELTVHLRIKSTTNRMHICAYKDSEYLDRASAELLEKRKHTYGWVALNKEIDAYPPVQAIVNDFDPTQPTISITSINGITATFKRDEGLLQITDTLGHVWLKK